MRNQKKPKREEKSMDEVKLMIVPGKIAKIPYVEGMTVLEAAKAAAEANPGSRVDWVGLVQAREVRVQRKKFSNTRDIPAGYVGTIFTTPVLPGYVIQVITKIAGNSNAKGLTVLVVSVDEEDFCSEAPSTLEQFLLDAGILGKPLPTCCDACRSRALEANREALRAVVVIVNGEPADLDDLVAMEDEIRLQAVEKPAPAKKKAAPAKEATTATAAEKPKRNRRRKKGS
jgi:hypothetical protein